MNERKKILAVMSAVFDINVADIPENASPDVIEKWDSMNHMALIIALEEEFGIRFTDAELTDLLNLDLIYEIISAKTKEGVI